MTKLNAARDEIQAPALPDFAEINEAKGDFTAIYNQPDPRSYFSTLGALDYRIPDEARPAFRRVIEAVKAHNGRTPRVLDMGCSYGVNAASLKYGLDFADLTAHYTEEEVSALGPARLAARDRQALSNQAIQQEATFVGLDMSPRAIAYAKTAGLLDDGLVADLETQSLPAAAAELVAETDLVISTGCIGYVGERTLGQIVDAVDGSGPWVASFVLRMFPFEPVADALAARGLVTEKLEGRTFRQRRFADADERNKLISHLGAMGLDPDAVESDGYLHAEFFLSRPAKAVRAAPLATLLAALPPPRALV